jgi:hypothetical protein
VQATATLQQLHTAAYRPPAQHFVARWACDPHTCGVQEGDLCFAGEHCSVKRFGSMVWTARYLSGLDAAKKLLSSAK